MTRSVEIPEEAVEAAATACHESDFAWSSEGVHDEYWRKMGRAAIAAALPYLAPAGDGGLREALNLWVREEIERAIKFHAATKGSGHQAGEMCDGWSALTEAMQLMHDDAHELLDTAPAVPQPVDREALAAAAHKYYCVMPGEPTHEPDEIDYDKADEILEILALTGEQEQVESPE